MFVWQFSAREIDDISSCGLHFTVNWIDLQLDWSGEVSVHWVYSRDHRKSLCKICQSEFNSLINDLSRGELLLFIGYNWIFKDLDLTDNNASISFNIYSDY